MNPPKNLTVRRFCKLVCVHPTIKRKNKYVIWVCQCDCGNLTEVRSGDLLSGHTKSCGCLRKETMSNFKHGAGIGGNRMRLYSIWVNMKSRCLNPKHLAYKYYGERGIKICGNWLNSYGNFRDWALANGYKDGLTIDRIDNDGNYTPINCQWITRSENAKKARAERQEEK